MKLLITGGCGFIASNLIRFLRRERPRWDVVNLDLLTYAANPDNLAGLTESTHYRFMHGDVADRALIERLFHDEGFDAVVHCAAESHVDRSINDGARFLRTNVEGTLVLLEAALQASRLRYVQVSTDEVYGSLQPDDPPFTELTPLTPRSPYSASKAAADLLTLAFHHTHGMDAIVTRCSNNYGPYQHPEKFIPLMICSAIKGLPLPVYGDGRQRRDWIHVEDHCSGLLAALEHGSAGEVYNFGGGAERENIEVVREVLAGLDADADLLRFVADRPGHDRRYSVSFAKAERELGWRPSQQFDEGLASTIRWYRQNDRWWTNSAAQSYAASQDRIRAWESRQNVDPISEAARASRAREHSW